MAIQRCKRPLESESDESPSTPRTSPHKKRLRARSNTPDTPLRLLSSPSARDEKSLENRCTTPESEEEDDVQRTVPTPEKETKDEHTPPTTPNRAAEEEHTPPAPEQEVAVGDAQPTPSASPIERTILPVVHKRADWPGLAGFKNWAILGDFLRAGGEGTWFQYLLERVGGEGRVNVEDHSQDGASVEHELAVQVDLALGEEADPASTLYLFWLGRVDCWEYETTDEEASRLSEEPEDDAQNHATEHEGDDTSTHVAEDDNDNDEVELDAIDIDNFDILVATLFDNIHHLYTKGARSFAVLNVPPVDRSPFAHSPIHWAGISAYAAKCVAVWNALLEAAARDFAPEHLDASLFVVSTHALFTALLDDGPDGRRDGEGGDMEEVWEHGDHTFTDGAQRYMAEVVALAFERV